MKDRKTMTFLVDIHVHPHNLIPLPFQLIFNLSLRKTKPKPFHLESMKEAKLNLVVANAIGDKFVTSMYGMSGFSSVRLQLRKIKKQANEMQALIYDDSSTLQQAKEENKPIILLGIEGGGFINGKLSRLKDLHQLGVRMLTIVHFSDNCFGSISTSFKEISTGKSKLKRKEEKGLTSFGKETVEELNSLGVIIDLAHANNKTTVEAAELSSQSVVASHSGVLNLQQKFPRYLTDEAIQAISKTGGVIGLWPYYFAKLGTREVEDFIEHAKYIKSLVGSPHIAIGTDINALPGIMNDFEYLQDFSNLKKIFQNYGFNEKEAEGISGENFVKMLDKN